MLRLRMSTPAQRKMTVDEFLVWAEGQDGRWEFYRGVPYPMTSERVRHGEVKFATQTALVQGIRKAGTPCRMLPAGATVRVSRYTAHKPDALSIVGRNSRAVPSRCPTPSSWSKSPLPPRARSTPH